MPNIGDNKYPTKYLNNNADSIYSALRKTNIRLIKIQIIIANTFYRPAIKDAIDECKTILETINNKINQKILGIYYNTVLGYYDKVNSYYDKVYSYYDTKDLNIDKFKLLKEQKYLNFKDHLGSLPNKYNPDYPLQESDFTSFTFENTMDNYIKFIELIESLQIRIELRVIDIEIIKMNSFNINVDSALDDCLGMLGVVSRKLGLNTKKYKFNETKRFVEKLIKYSEEIETYIGKVRISGNRKSNNIDFKELIDKKDDLRRTLQNFQTRPYHKIGSTDLNYKELYIYKHYLGFIENYSTALEHNKFNILKDNPEVIDHMYDILSIPEEKQVKLENLDYKQDDYNTIIQNGEIPYVRVLDEKVDKVGFLKFYPSTLYASTKNETYTSCYGVIVKIKDFLNDTLFEKYKSEFKDILENQSSSSNEYKNYPNIESIRIFKGQNRFNTLTNNESKKMLINREKSINKKIIEYSNGSIDSKDLNDLNTKKLRNKLKKGKKYLARLRGKKDCNDMIWGRYDSAHISKNNIENRYKKCDEEKINNILPYIDPIYTKNNITYGTAKNDILDKRLEGGQDRRPYLFGYSTNLMYYSNCNKYIKTLIMEKAGEGELIEWSRELNRLYTYCTLTNNKNILFPIIFILEDGTFPKRYVLYDKKYLISSRNYLGIIEISFYDNEKTKSIRKLYCFVYSHKETNFIMILDLYSRLVYPGTYMPTVTITYSELRNVGINYKNKNFETVLYRDVKNPNIVVAGLLENKKYIDELYHDKLKEIKIIKYNNSNKRMSRFLKDPINGFGTIYYFDDNSKEEIVPDKIESNDYVSPYGSTVQTKRDNNVNNHLFKGGNKTYIDSIYDIELIGLYYNKELELRTNIKSKFNNKKELILKNNPEYNYLNNIYSTNRLLHKYFYINDIPVSYDKNKNKNNGIHSKTILQIRKESSHPLWKYSKIILWLGKKIENTILQYQPVSLLSLEYTEILYFFNLKNKNILDISSKLAVTEIINYRNIQHNLNIKSNDFIYLKCNILKIQQEEQENIIFLYNRVQPTFKPIIIDTFPTYENFKEKISKKYDIIFLNASFGRYSMGDFWEHLDYQSNFTFIIFSLLSLTVDADMCIKLTGIKTYLTVDIIYILSKYFEEVKIFTPKLIYKTVTTRNFIICKKFKGLPEINEYLNIVKQMYNNDSSGGNKFNILNENIRKRYTVSKPITETNINYVFRLYDDDTRNSKEYLKIVEEVKKYNNEKYKDSYVCWLHLDMLLDKIMNNDKKTIDNLKRIQLVSSIDYAEKNDLPINPIFDIFKTKEDILKTFLKDISGPIEYLDYKISTKKKTLKLGNFDTEKPQKMKDFENHFNSMQLILDTREKGQYGAYSYPLHYFKDLSHTLERRFEVNNFTQAGIKMYEMLKTHSLIKDKETLHTFHLCELPGSFIFAIDLYINNETTIKDWKWSSQSLISPDVKEGFTNKYDLRTSFPNSWNFGKSKDGNITKLENIKYYIDHKKLSDADLITSDCGNNLKDCDLSPKLLFASILITICGCKKGANFLQKIYVPFNNLTISLIYICANYFSDSYLYKPVVNQFSTEIYFIFTDFTGMTFKQKEKLLQLYESFTTDVSLVNVPDSFIDELSKGCMKFGDLFNKSISDALHISDFFAENKDENLKKMYDERIPQIKKEQHNEWIRLFEFRNNKKTFMKKN